MRVADLDAATAAALPGAAEAGRRSAAAAAFGAPLSGAACLLYFAIAAGADIAIGLDAFPAILRGALVNPDTYMRLVRLRDMLAAHRVLDIVARDNGGAGTLLHWSHLIDGVMLLLAAPLSLAVGEATAVHSAALAFGPLAIGWLGLAIAWAVAPLTQPGWRWLAPLLAVLSPGIVGFAVPGEVHHHVPVAAASVMMAGWALRALGRGAAAGYWLGIWAAVGIWLTPESMPFLLAAFGGLGLFWLLHPENPQSGSALRAAGMTFLVLIAAELAVDPPYGGYGVVEIERLSIVYLGLGAAAAAIGWTLFLLDRRRLPPLRRGALGLLATAAALFLWFLAFPNVLAGPDGLLDARDTRLFFGAISDMQPIRTLPDMLYFLSDGAIAAVAAGVIAIRHRSPLWAYAAFCAVLTIALGALHRRFDTYPEIVAAAMLPVIVSLLDDGERRRPVAAALRFAAIALFLLLPQAGKFALSAAAAGGSDAAPAAGAQCDQLSLARLLRPYSGQIVLTDPGDTPAVLYWSRALTVGSLFHRNIDGFLRARAAWRSRPPADQVPAAVGATHAALVLVCPRPRGGGGAGGRSRLVADLPPDTLYDRLAAGRPPLWLTRAGAAAPSGYVLYRVTR